MVERTGIEGIEMMVVMSENVIKRTEVMVDKTEKTENDIVVGFENTVIDVERSVSLCDYGFYCLLLVGVNCYQVVNVNVNVNPRKDQNQIP